MTGERSARTRLVSLALGASVTALGAGLATPAAAQCTPDPTVANGTTTCTATDPDGLRVTTFPTTVTVAAGATVTAGTRPAIAVDVPFPAGFSFSNRAVTLNVLGVVTGTGQPGVALYTGASSTSFPSGTSSLSLTVGANGAITGTTALTLFQTAGNNGGYGIASVDNSGRLTGTSGIALSATNPSLTAFSTITNRATGTITGGISGAVGTLTNAGVIDGGALSAINSPANTFIIAQGPWTNTGTIRSASAAATIQNGAGNAITNSGTIANSGAGAAIAGAGLTVTN